MRSRSSCDISASRGGTCRFRRRRDTSTTRPRPSLTCLPAIAKQAQFLHAPDQRPRVANAVAVSLRTLARIMRTEAALDRSSPMTCQARTGCREAVQRHCTEVPIFEQVAASRRVVSAMTMASGCATACSRAARFGVSPSAVCSRAAPAFTSSPTTTRPVAMPMRTCRRSREHVELGDVARRAQAPHARRARRCLHRRGDNRSRPAHRRPCSGRRSHRSVQRCRRRSGDMRR